MPELKIQGISFFILIVSAVFKIYKKNMFEDLRVANTEQYIDI